MTPPNGEPGRSSLRWDDTEGREHEGLDVDDRYLFFALTDADFFDVPWAVADDPPLETEHVSGFRQVTAGPWIMHLPDAGRLPDSGWKIHVSALPHSVHRTAAVIARLCATERVAWKIIRSVSLVRAAQGKYAPRSISGKVGVVYPRDEDQLIRLVTRLAAELEGSPAPRIHGDYNHPAAPIGIRWGSFQEKWIETADGRTVPGAATAQGVRQDDRSSSRRALPKRLVPAFTPRDPAEPLPLTQVRVVHRSNAGALYDALLEDGRRVAVKEARHHAALSPEGSDAVARLRHEHAALRRLSGQDIAPEPIDYWELTDSDMLVMTWCGDESLSVRVGRTHPASSPAAEAAGELRYRAWVEETTAALTGMVESMHRLEVTHGDIHPGNVVLGPDGPRLVDLEAASIDGVAVTCTMGAPGFHLDDPDPLARDLFGLARTCAHLRDPDIALADRRPDLAAAAFGVGPDADGADAPVGVVAMLDRLADDMLARATPERDDRLFPGGSEQFTRPLGAHDLLSGAAGSLLALQAHGRDPRPAHLDWLARPTSGAATCRGLGEGVDGIALALARLGRPEQAAALIDRCPAQPPSGLSWARGRAGCAVALAELGILLDRSDLSERSRDLTHEIIAEIDNPTEPLTAPGLLEGWAGVSLALLRIRDLLPDEHAPLTTAAGAALRREQIMLREVHGVLVGCPGGRHRIGLGHGSGAFALAARALDDSALDLARAGLAAARAAQRVTSPVAGLLEGLAGAAAVLHAYGENEALAAVDERATWHCAPTRRGWSVLGAQRLRCSDDLATGSAGLIAALGPDRAQRLSTVLCLPVWTPADSADDSCHSRPLPSDTAAPVAAAL